MYDRLLLAPALLAIAACAAAPTIADAPSARAIPADQQAFLDACEDWDDWDKPAPPFRIYGGTYYVGTCGISAILVTHEDGHSLIDTGTEEGAKVVLANIAKLGFDPKNVDTITLSHEHFDHVGGIASVQYATGAKVYSSPAATKTLHSGLPSADDPQAASDHPAFRPLSTLVFLLEDGKSDPVGPKKLKPIVTPGHTPGALSWQWRECEGSDCRWLVYADSLSPISADDYRFSDHPEYVADFRAGLDRLAKAQCDILMTPHPSASDMLARMKGESGLLLADGCAWYPERIGNRLDKRLAEEAAK